MYLYPFLKFAVSLSKCNNPRPSEIQFSDGLF